MKILTLILSILFSVIGSTEAINVGGVLLRIPNPSGYFAIGHQFSMVFDYQQQFVPPENKQFIYYIKESEISTVLKNELPDLTRAFAIQSPKKLLDLKISRSDFKEIKKIIRDDSQKYIPEIQGDINKLLADLSNENLNQSDLREILRLSQIILLPPHRETNQSIAYSLFARIDSDGSGVTVRVVTSTVLHLGGKVLFLYSYAEGSALEWSRQISQNWSDAIISAN